MTRTTILKSASAIAIGIAAFAAATPAAAQGVVCELTESPVSTTNNTGKGATATGLNSLACGPNAVALLDDNLAVGDGATATGVRSTAVGTDSMATNEETTAVGYDATATGFNSSAFGALADATGRGATAIGWNADATDEEATAVGFNAKSTGFHSTAVGALADATGRGSTAIGWDADATALLSTAVGNSARATATNATAIGRSAVASGVDSTALGQGASATQLDSTALGQGAQAIHANSVALGAGTTTTAANQVNVGGRTISGVSAGTAAMDAVNFSQLTATNSAVTNEAVARGAGDSALGTRIDNLSFNLDDRLRRTGREARSGTASALAAAGLPQVLDAGRTMIAGGVGYYRGKGALAIGASHRLSNGSTVFKVGVTYDSAEHVGANGGVGFQF